MPTPLADLYEKETGWWGGLGPTRNSACCVHITEEFILPHLILSEQSIILNLNHLNEHNYKMCITRLN